MQKSSGFAADISLKLQTQTMFTIARLPKNEFGLYSAY